jgi:hypothetical protein
MLPEERALREWANDGTIQRRRKINKAISALICAVREEGAKACEEATGSKTGKGYAVVVRGIK